MQLRPYQEELITNIKQSIRRGNKRIIACASTGYGKSVTMAGIVMSAKRKNKRVNIFLPRRSLVLQLSKSFTEYGINHGVVMSGIRPFTQPAVQIISIDTYTSRLKSGKMQFIGADMILIDELHVQFTPKKLELFNKYPLAIGFTATAVAPKKQPLNIFYQDIVNAIPMKELVDMNHLAPLRYFAPSEVDLSKIKTNQDGDYQESSLGDVMDKPKLVGDIVENWLRIASDRSTVVFCSSQSHARHLKDEFMRNNVVAEYCDCYTEDDDRDVIFENIKSGRTRVVCQVGILTIGVDIPILSCCVIACPTKLISKYLQMIGRIVRIYAGKLDGIVIDHCGIVNSLGFADDEQFWTLDGSPAEEVKQKAKEDAKEPKEITCYKCKTVFKSSRKCPECGYEMIPQGEAIPTYQAELKEIKKATPEDKQSWYSQLLHYAQSKGYKRGYADHKFKDKFGHYPAKKKGVIPLPPTKEVLNHITYLNIKSAKSRV
jgi:superfamily II DNA or RNA helicase